MNNLIYAGVPEGTTSEPVATAAPSASSGLFQMLFLLLIFFVMMYFLVILPQKRREKQFKQMIASIRRGDTVVTSGGVVGKVIDVKNETLKIKTANTTELEISKAFVARVLKNKNEKTEKSEKNEKK
ncbi:preprotein translocase subunit YajC [Thermosipho atlanticus]|uniref:Protein translocase subunit yajC n=1 Tax=Thermosipho atlanticus DSM 15807 TaxID=1123380 RepID=A0A1M5SGQ6_9BACT|nr:preprotein translocase subunit YajC [Thermosipho atlanticus]SHH37724.1 protein translocase subunit yajC [Thermosipho atlanticus DSM 15807]